MPERFKKLYSIPKNLYFENSPVLIEAGSLLLDTQTNRVLAQLKLLNVCCQTIISCKVYIRTFEPNGSEIGEGFEFQYLDLYEKHGESFGSKVPIMIDRHTCRKIDVAITEIVCKDGTIWTHNVDTWEPLDLRQYKFDEVYKDKETLKQINIDIRNSTYLYIPRVTSTLFQCACGDVSLGTKCIRCKAENADLARKLDETSILEHKNARLCAEEEEKEERQRLAKIREESEKQKREEKKQKVLKIVTKPWFIIGSGILVVALAIGITLYAKNVIIPERRYQVAREYFLGRKYAEAKIIYDELGNYKSSRTLSASCTYKIAEQKEANKEYDKAIELWNSIPDYADSTNRVIGVEDKLLDNTYEYGCQLLSNGRYVEAIELFDEIGEYKDTKSKTDEAKFKYVTENKDQSNIQAYEYLHELKDNNYDGAEKLYNELYDWRIKITSINDSETSNDNMSSIYKGSPIYFHFDVLGGPPNEELILKARATYPDGYVEDIHKVKENLKNNDNSWVGWKTGIWEEPEDAPAGALRVEFFDENDNPIGEGLINTTD